MRPAGDSSLARWREAGEWWNGEPYLEFFQHLDSQGIRREHQMVVSASVTDDSTEQLRIRKMRDEKVARACGAIPFVFRSVSRSDRSYAALHVYSGYAFGRSTLLAEEIPVLAAERGASSVLLADPFSLVGAVEFYHACKNVGIKPLIGSSFEMAEGGELVLIAQNRRGYVSLSRLITECHMNEPRLYPLCDWDRLERHSEGLICLSGGHQGLINRHLMRRDFSKASTTLERLISVYGKANVFIEIERSFQPWEKETNSHLLDLAGRYGIIAVAGGLITHSNPSDYPAQDVLVCVDTLCTIEEIIGRKPQRAMDQPAVRPVPKRSINAERYIRSSEEMAELYSDRPDLLMNAVLVADRCEVDLLPNRTQMPEFCSDEPAALRELTYSLARRRYDKMPPRLHQRIERELNTIISLGFARHFLVAHDMCRWAETKDILFSGRGSVIDSVIAYCLGFSRIDAFKHNLLFDRFLPGDGSKRPDIDIDFEARRREDVRQYLTRKYGKEHVATVAAIGTYCSRGIVREVGKVMGLPEETIGFLAKRIHGGIAPDQLEAALDDRPELRNSNIPKERFRWVFRLAKRLMDVPRNIRAHSSGVVISDQPIADTVPVMMSGVDEVQIIQWDKRSSKKFFDKFDILCLRGNDVLAGVEGQLRLSRPGFKFDHEPTEDPETYRAMRSGALIGIPQSASPAMRQAHIRLKTSDLKDASLVQAGIRPGVGGAVKLNELIARRHGKPYQFSHPDLERILGHTYGIIVFQEQVDELLQVFGGYSPGEAEDARESIYKRRREGYAESIKAQIVERIKANGYNSTIADEVYEYVSAFQGYGFAQGHALAFAEISIRSVWYQQNHPAEYFAALLNAQPAGYYGPDTLANEARSRGIKILPPDVNRSGLAFTVEDVRSETDPWLVFPNGGIRCSLGQVSGVSINTLEKLGDVRSAGQFQTFFDFVARVRPDRDELEQLILSGALNSLHQNRRALLWNVSRALDYAIAARSDALPMFTPEPELITSVDDFSEVQKAIYERSILGMNCRQHLMAFERERVRQKGGLMVADVNRAGPDQQLFAVGIPIRLRFPPTPGGKRVVFFDLEDETGLLNVTCFDDVYQRYGHALICSPYVTVLGRTQDRDGHTAFLAERIYAYQPVIMRQIGHLEMPIDTADFLTC